VLGFLPKMRERGVKIPLPPILVCLIAGCAASGHSQKNSPKSATAETVTENNQSGLVNAAVNTQATGVSWQTEFGPGVVLVLCLWALLDFIEDCVRERYEYLSKMAGRV
jgi:hypothetical protein